MLTASWLRVASVGTSLHNVSLKVLYDRSGTHVPLCITPVPRKACQCRLPHMHQLGSCHDRRIPRRARRTLGDIVVVDYIAVGFSSGALPRFDNRDVDIHCELASPHSRTNQRSRAGHARMEGRNVIGRIRVNSPRDLPYQIWTRRRSRSILVCCSYVEALPACEGRTGVVDSGNKAS